MFAAHRAAVLQHQVAYLLGYRHHAFHAVLPLEVDQRAYVQAADAGVAVVACGGAVLLHYLVEAAHELRQHVGGHRGVLHERKRLGAARHVHHQAQPRLAHLPHLRLLGGRHQPAHGVAHPAAPHARLEQVEPGRHLRLGVPDELDHEYRLGVSLDEVHQPGVDEIIARLAQDHAAYVLHGGGLQLQRGDGGLHRLDEVGEVQHAQAPEFGPLNNLDLGFGDGDERALRAYGEARHVERAAADELVQVVARNAALDPGIAGQNLVAVCVADGEQLAVDVAFQPLDAHLRLELAAVQRAEARLVAVGQYHVHIQHVVDRLAPQRRVGAAGVVAERASHVAAAAGARVGREEHVVRGEVVVELVENNAGLGARPALLGVHLDHVPHVLGEVHDHGLAHRLARQAGAAAPGQHGHAVAVGGLDHGYHVLGVTGQHHAHRLDLVDAGVGGVQQARHLVEAHLACDDSPQVLGQCLGIGVDVSNHGSNLACGLF